MSHQTGSTSFAAISATLVPVAITAAVYLGAFCLIRSRYRFIYAPRTYFATIPEQDRTPSSSHSSVSWWHDYKVLDDKFVLRHSSLDGYLFLRFLRMIVIICAVGTCLTWPILFPVNATGGGGASQLDKIAFGNIDNPKKLYAHAIVAWVFLIFVLIVITRERYFAINVRQAQASIKQNALRLSSRVILFLAVPDFALDRSEIQRYFGSEAINSWPVPKVEELESATGQRSSKVEQLEQAEYELEMNVVKQQGQKKSKNMPDEQARPDDDNNGDQTRPKHRSRHVVGSSVDTLAMLRKDITNLDTKIQSLKEALSDNMTEGSVALFVEYKDQAAAHQAYQQVRHHQPLALQPRFLPVQPKEVLWSNLNMDPALRITYSYLAVTLIIATIIFWSIPISIIGFWSNVSNLTDKFKFLRFINDLPSPILGFLTGFVPAYILSEVVSYVPKFFRYIAKTSGQPTTVAAELMTQKWYFVFQVVQVFLVTTFSSGAAAVGTKIASDPTAAPILLARNVPKAANFYLAYFVVQGIGSSANTILNYSDLFEYLFYDKFIDKTPRQKYSRRSSMKGAAWGKWYPKFTNFAVIALAYSCIAPLLLGFAAVGLYLFYLCYKYQLLYVVQIKLETRGASYTMALQHLMVGVYLSQLCLLGLFSIKEATGPSVLMGVLLVLTAIYHITVDRYLTPLEQQLPLDVLADDDEEEPLLNAEEGGVRQQSRVHRAARGKLPTRILDPLAAFLEPNLFASVKALRPWLQDPATTDDVPHYSDEEVKNAYLNPALTSKTPKAWMPKDQQGISTQEIEENKKAGVPTTDDGAELDTEGNLHWDMDDFSKAPIFKIAKKF